MNKAAMNLLIHVLLKNEDKLVFLLTYLGVELLDHRGRNYTYSVSIETVKQFFPSGYTIWPPVLS